MDRNDKNNIRTHLRNADAVCRVIGYSEPRVYNYQANMG